MLRRIPLLVTLLVTACLSGETVTIGGDTTTTTISAPTTTAPGTSTTAPSLTTSLTTAAATTTTTPRPPEAAFTITQVVFGEEGYVEVLNYGGTPGDPGGRWLVQASNQFRLPAVTLQPDDTVWVAVGEGEAQQGAVGIDTVAVVPAHGAIGELSRRGGEMMMGAAEDPETPLAYVAWGEGPHDHLDQAAAAGVWEPGGTVDPPFDSFGLRAVIIPPLGPDDWIAQVGG